MDDSSVRAVPAGNAGISQINGNIEVTAKQVALSNGSTVTTSTPTGPNHFTGSPGNITFNVITFSATNSTISASVFNSSAPSGAVTIQGLQGSGASAHSVSLTNSSVSTSDGGLLPSFPGALNTDGGPILIRADNITLNQSTLNAFSAETTDGPITLVSRNRIVSDGSRLSTNTFVGSGGTVNLRAGAGIDLTGTTIDAHSSFTVPGTVSLAAPVISIRGSALNVWRGGIVPGGTISITGSHAVTLTNGTVLDADNVFKPPPPVIPSTTNANGGTILINGGRLFTSQNSTISAQSVLGNGGVIQIEANKVNLTDTKVTTSVSGGPQTVGGSITVDAKNTTLTNSQILSTATEGHGGTIDITSPVMHQAGSVMDASSQSGTDGTVTINGIVQP